MPLIDLQSVLKAPETRAVLQEPLIAAPVFLFVTILFFFPFAPITNLSGWMPGDASQFTFFLGWGHYAWSNFMIFNYFDLPISHPLQDAGGLTDILPGVALISLHFNLFADDPSTIYNLTVLQAGFLNCMTCYILARRLNCLPLAAGAASIVFAFNSQMQWHAMGHLSVLSFYFAPVALWMFVEYRRSGRWVFLLLAGAAIFLQGFTSSRLGIILLLGFAVFILSSGLRPWRGRPLWHPLIFAGAVLTAALMVFLFYRPALAMKEQLPSRRTMMDVVGGSADPVNLIVPNMNPKRDLSFSGKVINRLFGEFPQRGESQVFPGYTTYLVLLAVSLLAIILWIKRRKIPLNPETLKEMVPWVSMFLVMVIFALGPFLWIGQQITSIRLPWYYFVEVISGLATFRTPARLALIAWLALGVLVARALSYGFRSAGFSWKLQLPVMLLVIAGYVADFYVLAELYRRDSIPRSSERMEIIAEHRKGAVASLPVIADQNFLLELMDEYPPTINTFNGGLTNDYASYTELLYARFPNPETIQFSRDNGIGLFVIRDPDLQKKVADHPEFTDHGLGVFVLDGVTDEAMDRARERGLPIRLVKPAPPPPTREFPDSTNRKIIPVDFSAERSREISLLSQLERMESDDFLKLRATGNDGQLHLPFSFNPRDIDSISVKMRTVNTLTDEATAVMYWRNPESGFSAEKAARVRYQPSDDWQVLTFELKDNPLWNEAEEVNQTRYDLENPTTPLTILEVAEIRFNYRHGENSGETVE